MSALHKDYEEGIAAIWMALLLLFLIGATALAVDTSGFFKSARIDQTTADLACLAGVQELPLRPDAALTIASENVRANFPEMTGATATPIPRGVELVSGGNLVTIHAPAENNPLRMVLDVTSSESRGFSRIWSSADVLVTQHARCMAVPDTGPTLLPVATVSGSFDEDLSECADNADGETCGVIQSGDGSWVDAFAEGMTGEFEKHWGNWASQDPDTGQVGLLCPYGSTSGFTDLCNAVWPEDHSMQSELAAGLNLRMSGAGAPLSEFQGVAPQSLDDVFGPSEPSWWEASLYGPYAANRDQRYWDENIIDCSSPRLAMLPIVERNENWALGLPGGTWDTTAYLKIVGFYSIYIRNPGSGFAADVIWFGPNATCDGQALDFYENVGGSETVKLVGA
jgi:hypothetical protein